LMIGCYDYGCHLGSKVSQSQTENRQPSGLSWPDHTVNKFKCNRFTIPIQNLTHHFGDVSFQSITCSRHTYWQKIEPRQQYPNRKKTAPNEKHTITHSKINLAHTSLPVRTAHVHITVCNIPQIRSDNLPPGTPIINWNYTQKCI